MQYQDTLDAFRLAMAEAGMIVDEPLSADGALRRVYVDGDKRGSKNGAYVLHADGNPAGWAMHYRTGVTVNWSASGQRQPMTDAMRRQIANDKAKRQLEQEQRQRDAADKARFIWHRAAPIPCRDDHPYLIRKRVDPRGLRLGRDGVLVVPILNADLELVNLQFISADGDKRFLSGGRKQGCFAVIGRAEAGKPILICEGWATGASIHQDGGHFVAVALDKGNLEPVAGVFRALATDAEIIIAGDNDLDGGGQTAARQAALAVGGKYIIPPRPGDDWNDHISAKGASHG